MLLCRHLPAAACVPRHDRSPLLSSILPCPRRRRWSSSEASSLLKGLTTAAGQLVFEKELQTLDPTMQDYSLATLQVRACRLVAGVHLTGWATPWDGHPRHPPFVREWPLERARLLAQLVAVR